MECFSSSNTLNLRLSSVGLGPYGYAYRPPAMLDPYNKRPRPLAAAMSYLVNMSSDVM